MTRRPSKTLSRRAFVRGAAGTAIALPLADFTFDGRRVLAEGAAPARRLFVFYIPGGWEPSQFTFQSVLSPLKEAGLDGLTTLITNLKNPAAMQLVDAGLVGPINPHAIAVGATFTGAPLPSDPAAALRSAGGPTIDQIAAAALGQGTAIDAIVAGLYLPAFDATAKLGVHANNFSWRDPNTPVPPVTDPLLLFNKLFGGAGAQQDDAAAKLQRALKKSVLDTAVDGMREMSSDRYGLPKASRAVLAQHLEMLRDFEVKAAKVASSAEQQCLAGAAPAAAPAAASVYGYDDFDAAYGLMGAMIVAAMQCDVVRFGGLAYGGCANNVTFSNFVPPNTENNQHLLGHSAGELGQGSYVAADYANYHRYATHFVAQMAAVLAKAQAVKEANGQSLLENSLIYVASEMGHGYNHHFEPTMAALIGAKGAFAPGAPTDAGGRSINDVLLSALLWAGVKGMTALGPAAFNGGPLFPV